MTLPRRPQHYVARTVYLGVIWILGLTTWQAAVGWEQNATLGDIAQFSLRLFQITTMVQLIVLIFFASLSAASSITTEKDRRTFVLLLMTRLTNVEIVVGKLLGSLLQIGLFLLGTLPILALMLFMGGVAGFQIVQAAIVLFATALAAGSLGVLISLWRDRTFQALALTVLFLVLHLCFVFALPYLMNLSGLFQSEVFTSEGLSTAQQWLDPIRAMQSVIEPDVNRVGLAPGYGFGLTMLGISVVLNLLGIWKLRVWNPSGGPIMQREAPDAADEKTVEREKAHAAPGAVREVWPNPILWREMMTRAYGRRPLLVKAAYFLVVGLVVYYAVAPIIEGQSFSRWSAAYGLVPLAILSLLLITAQAVTSITTERDMGALNLLLVTDLTPSEFIWGKLGGIVYNTKEYLIPPIALAIFYAAYGMLAFPATPTRNIQAGVCVALAIAVLEVFVIVLGVHVALRAPTSRLAIGKALGTVFFLSVGTLVCIYIIAINGQFEYQWASFVFFLAAGIGGFWWVLSGNRPAPALTLASIACPLAIFYSVLNILIGNPKTQGSADPFLPLIVTAGSFGFAITAMLVPMLSEFDVAMGRTTGEAD
ncbi:MAG: ABC transporter permease subunit [Gemmataceae bacterium]